VPSDGTTIEPRQFIVVTTKPMSLGAFVSKLRDASGLAIVGCAGLPESTHVDWIRQLPHHQCVGFFGDLDPPDLRELVRLRAWERLNVVILFTMGLPRLEARRFVHRLHQECGPPVCVLTDCTTWGYFSLSLILRGALCPSARLPEAAVPVAAHVGLRVAQCTSAPKIRALGNRCKRHYTDRLNALRANPCFRGRAWKTEFDDLEKARRTWSVDQVLGWSVRVCLSTTSCTMRWDVLAVSDVFHVLVDSANRRPLAWRGRAALPGRCPH